MVPDTGALVQAGPPGCVSCRSSWSYLQNGFCRFVSLLRTIDHKETFSTLHSGLFRICCLFVFVMVIFEMLPPAVTSVASNK